MQSLPGCVFSGVILDSRTSAFQALHMYPFAFQTRASTTVFILFWHMLPNSQTRILLCQPYPSISHHTFLSGVSVLVLCGALKCKYAYRFPSAGGVLQQWSLEYVLVVQALGKARKHLLYGRISSCFCLEHLYKFEVIHLAVLSNLCSRRWIVE